MDFTDTAAAVLSTAAAVLCEILKGDDYEIEPTEEEEARLIVESPNGNWVLSLRRAPSESVSTDRKIDETV